MRKPDPDLARNILLALTLVAHCCEKSRFTGQATPRCGGIGVADINTTQVYVEIDMEMKRRMLEKSPSPAVNSTVKVTFS